MKLGDPVKLVRKITGEVLVMKLAEVLTKTSKPAVEVEWRSERAVGRSLYKLDLVKNEVIAIGSSTNSRQSMRAWYTINEEDRKALTELFWNERKRGK